MNKVFIKGFVSKNPDARTTPNGKLVCRFHVAVNEYYGGEKHPVYIPCEAWGKTAETIQKHFHKGMPILIEGHARFSSFKDKEGRWKTYASILVAEFEFCGSGKPGNTTPDNGGHEQGYFEPSQAYEQEYDQNEPVDSMYVSEDDLPY